MIPPWSSIVITVVFCQLGFLASAYAESAWVLWTAHHAGLKTYWQWRDAFDGRAACLQVLDRKQKDLGGNRAHRVSETIVIVDPAPGVLGEGFEYHCLPDTVDPRWPKGK
jgi:hypothetical protein